MGAPGRRLRGDISDADWEHGLGGLHAMVWEGAELVGHGSVVQRWRGPTSVLAPAGILPTPAEDGSIYVLPGSAPIDLDAGLTCDWREGDVW